MALYVAGGRLETARASTVQGSERELCQASFHGGVVTRGNERRRPEDEDEEDDDEEEEKGDGH